MIARERCQVGASHLESISTSRSLPVCFPAYRADLDADSGLNSDQGAGRLVALLGDVLHAPKRFVYILRSIESPERRYIGVSSDVGARLNAHNGGDPSTTRWKPWFVDVCVEFRAEQLALRFEKYLKSGSGHAFAKSHFT
jgi:putative endonuclease